MPGVSITLPNSIPPKHQAWIFEYIGNGLDGVNAARAVGYKKPHEAAERLLNPNKSPLVVAAIREHLEKLEKTNHLTADYTRDYIYTVLNFKPGQYFKPGGDGGWLIDENVYQTLPDKIARIVEEIEVREISLPDGTVARKYWCRFVSKTSAMVTAAKYTLTQKYEQTAGALDFDQIMAKCLQQRLAKVAKQAVAGAIEDKSPAIIPSTNGTNGAPH